MLGLQHLKPFIENRTFKIQVARGSVGELSSIVSTGSAPSWTRQNWLSFRVSHSPKSHRGTSPGIGMCQAAEAVRLEVVLEGSHKVTVHQREQNKEASAHGPDLW